MTNGLVEFQTKVKANYLEPLLCQISRRKP